MNNHYHLLIETIEKVWKAYAQYGYTMKEIANYLSIHYTTVSKIINQRKNNISNLIGKQVEHEQY